jgi:membrane-associated phospholipid phosphatase
MAVRVSAFLAAAFAALTTAVALDGGLPGEQRVLRLASSGQVLDPVWRVVDRSTGYLGMSVLAALLVLALVVARRHREAVLTASSFVGALIGTTLLKHLVGRPRPEALPSWAEVSELSYPSGHATATAAVGLCLVLMTRGSRCVLAAVVVLVGVAGWAQLALGLHFPSDVLAGWLWAAAWTTVVWVASGRLHASRC